MNCPCFRRAAVLIVALVVMSLSLTGCLEAAEEPCPIPSPVRLWMQTAWETMV